MHNVGPHKKFRYDFAVSDNHELHTLTYSDKRKTFMCDIVTLGPAHAVLAMHHKQTNFWNQFTETDKFTANLRCLQATLQVTCVPRAHRIFCIQSMQTLFFNAMPTSKLKWQL